MKKFNLSQRDYHKIRNLAMHCFLDEHHIVYRQGGVYGKQLFVPARLRPELLRSRWEGRGGGGRNAAQCAVFLQLPVSIHGVCLWGDVSVQPLCRGPVRLQHYRRHPLLENKPLRQLSPHLCVCACVFVCLYLCARRGERIK